MEKYLVDSFLNNSIRLWIYDEDKRKREFWVDFDSERFIKDSIDIDTYYKMLHKVLLNRIDEIMRNMKRAEKKIKRKERSDLKAVINESFCYDITYNIMSYIN